MEVEVTNVIKSPLFVALYTIEFQITYSIKKKVTEIMMQTSNIIECHLRLYILEEYKEWLYVCKAQLHQTQFFLFSVHSL